MRVWQTPMTPAQGELFALPVPTRGAARCQLGRRYGKAQTVPG